MPAHRLVLLALLAPMIAIGAVLWFLLPGSVAGISYTPSQYSREAKLQPIYWSSHRATLRGYAAGQSCTGSQAAASSFGTTLPMCGRPARDDGRVWLLVDTALTTGTRADRGLLSSAVAVQPQGEAGWHSLLRRVAPALLAAPFPQGVTLGKKVTITGTLILGSEGAVPVLQPDAL